ncbi:MULTISPECIES: MgtC/SapB family protein [Olivibacter]|nr:MULTISPECIES: MgtC/SapB family protein [Olivibacter]MDM8173965.1 MgtC/SapB family protein [Olivibacter sp. 47]
MLSYQETVIRLVLAAAFGAAVGLERERKNWAAGMRTHMMVCLGASLMMMVSSFGFSDILKTGHVTLDPSRVAAQVVSGIGFLGAGTIMFLKQGIVKGLTTASGL